MLERVELDRGDRVLFLTIPDPPLVEEFAARLSRGLVAVMGACDPVYEARKAAAHLENVMFTPATAEEIPWQEQFFSWVIDTRGGWELDGIAAREIHRVLTLSGRTWLANLDVAPLVGAGFVESGSGAGFRVLRKAAKPFGGRGERGYGLPLALQGKNQ